MIQIGTWCEARKAMEIDRQVTRALRGGTTAMRAMGQILLPADFRERQNPADYQARLLRTTLTSLYDDALGHLVSRPFQRAVSVTGEPMPPTLERLEVDCDRMNTSLTEFARLTFDDLVDTGLAITMVDRPDNRRRDEQGRVVVAEDGTPIRASLAEEIAQDVRPYFVRIHPDRLISWKWTADATGKRVLDWVQILEDGDNYDAHGNEIDTQRIRVWYRDGWELYQRTLPQKTQRSSNTVQANADLISTANQQALTTQADEDNAFVLIDQGTHNLGEVPLRFRNVCPVGADPLWARPPLRDLAWKNVEDWQMASAESNNLHWHSYPALVISGADSYDKEAASSFAYGAGALMVSSNPDFEASLMETSGAAAKALADRRATIKAEAEAMGNAPLVRVGGPETATGEMRDEQASQSQAQAWVEALEWLLYADYQLAAKWDGVELPEDFDVAIFRDFGLPARQATTLQALSLMRQRGDISRETMWRMAQEFRWLPADFDPVLEAERVEAERDAMGGIFPGGPDLAAFGGDAGV